MGAVDMLMGRCVGAAAMARCGRRRGAGEAVVEFFRRPSRSAAEERRRTARCIGRGVVKAQVLRINSDE